MNEELGPGRLYQVGPGLQQRRHLHGTRRSSAKWLSGRRFKGGERI